MTGHTEMKCAAFGCLNRSSDGHFVGDFCGPCDTAFRTGKAEFGTSFVFEQRLELVSTLKWLKSKHPGPTCECCRDLRERIESIEDALTDEERSQ